MTPLFPSLLAVVSALSIHSRQVIASNGLAGDLTLHNAAAGTAGSNSLSETVKTFAAEITDRPHAVRDQETKTVMGAYSTSTVMPKAPMEFASFTPKAFGSKSPTTQSLKQGLAVKGGSNAKRQSGANAKRQKRDASPQQNKEAPTTPKNTNTNAAKAPAGGAAAFAALLKGAGAGANKAGAGNAGKTGAATGAGNKAGNGAAGGLGKFFKGAGANRAGANGANGANGAKTKTPAGATKPVVPTLTTPNKPAGSGKPVAKTDKGLSVTDSSGNKVTDKSLLSSAAGGGSLPSIPDPGLSSGGGGGGSLPSLPSLPSLSGGGGSSLGDASIPASTPLDTASTANTLPNDIIQSVPDTTSLTQSVPDTSALTQSLPVTPNLSQSLPNDPPVPQTAAIEAVTQPIDAPTPAVDAAQTTPIDTATPVQDAAQTATTDAATLTQEAVQMDAQVTSVPFLGSSNLANIPGAQAKVAQPASDLVAQKAS